MRARKSKKEQAKQKIKNNIKTGVVIFSLVVLVVVAAFTVSFYMYTSGSEGVVYPASPLTKIMDEPYFYVEDETLNISIQCPTIPVILSVGGTERAYNDVGCVFRYNEDLSISVYEVSTTAYDILSTNFALDLYNGVVSGEAVYIPQTDLFDVGYFNSYPAEYQCGYVNICEEDGITIYNQIYVLSLVLDMGFDKKLMITVSSTNDRALYDAEILLESIAYTVVDASLTLGYNSAEIAEQDVIRIEEDTLIKGESVLEQASDLEESVGDAFIDIMVPIMNKIDGRGYVVLQYTNTDADISNIYLYEPDKETSYENSSVTKGVLVYCMDKPAKGNWCIKIPNGIDLGTYTTMVYSKQEFMSSIYPSALPKAADDSLEPVQSEEE